MSKGQKQTTAEAQVARAAQLVARGRVLLDTWEEEDQIDRARRLFQRAIELAPDSAEAWRGLADALEENEEHDLALHAYGHALELGATGVEVWRGVARAA